MIGALFTLLVSAAVLQSASSSLLRSAFDPNPALRSYTAAATLVARVHAVIPLQQSFTGTAYYVKPKQKVVFDNVPAQLAPFRTLDASVPTYGDATANYVIAPLTNDGKLSTYELVPKNAGARVKSIVIVIDDDVALVTSAVWTYGNGGRLTITQQYETIGTYRLPSSINIVARFLGYVIDGVIHLSNYRTNVEVPNVFQAETRDERHQ
jgi:hypothetical protein